MHLLITRSEPGAGRMAQALAETGLSSFVCPLINAVPTGQPLPEPADLPQGNCFNHVIFVSEHAVEHGLAAVRQIGSGAQWYAIGPATGMALQAAMLRHRPARPETVNIPELARSEGLLADQRLQLLDGHQVLLVAGEDGRELLADTLGERGAAVASWLPYRRAALPADTLARTLIANGGGSKASQLAAIEGCVASSGQGLELLTHQWLQAGGSVDLPVCVPSPRVAAMARALGWLQPVLCSGASAQATVAGLRNAGLLARHSDEDKSPH